VTPHHHHFILRHAVCRDIGVEGSFQSPYVIILTLKMAIFSVVGKFTDVSEVFVASTVRTVMEV
jgi:hypothetical protein